MAYSLPSMNNAAQYVASFRQVQPVSGFDDVLSTNSSDTIANHAYADFMAASGMAKQALAEQMATKRQEMVLDSKDRELDFYRERDQRAEEIAKKTALANLWMGGFGSGGGGTDLSDLQSLINFNNATTTIGNQSTIKNAPVDESVQALSELASGLTISGKKPQVQFQPAAQQTTVTKGFDALPTNWDWQKILEKQTKQSK